MCVRMSRPYSARVVARIKCTRTICAAGGGCAAKTPTATAASVAAAALETGDFLLGGEWVDSVLVVMVM